MRCMGNEPPAHVWASSQAAEPVKKGGSYEPSISERSEWRRDRGRVVGTRTRCRPDLRGDLGADDALASAADGGRPAGPTRGVGLPHHNPAGAAARARNEGVLYRRG